MSKIMRHAEYQERLRGLPNRALRFIIQDAQEAIQAMPDGPNAGYYADEVNYAGMELQRRQKSMHKWEQPVGDQLATLNRIDAMLRKAGYKNQDTLDNLRDLLKSAERPATESGVKTAFLYQDDCRDTTDGYHLDVWKGICEALGMDVEEDSVEIMRVGN